MHPVTNDLSEHHTLVIGQVVYIPPPTPYKFKRNSLLECFFYVLFLVLDALHKFIKSRFDLIVVERVAFQVLPLTDDIKFFPIALHNSCKINKTLERLFCLLRRSSMYFLFASAALLKALSPPYPLKCSPLFQTPMMKRFL